MKLVEQTQDSEALIADQLTREPWLSRAMLKTLLRSMISAGTRDSDLERIEGLRSYAHKHEFWEIYQASNDVLSEAGRI